MIEDFDEYIHDLMTKLEKTKLTPEQKSIIGGAGFCNPAIFMDYFKNCICFVDDDPKFSKRMFGIILWATVLTNADKLTVEELLKARKALGHGFVQMSGNRKIKAMLMRIGKDFI